MTNDARKEEREDLDVDLINNNALNPLPSYALAGERVRCKCKFNNPYSADSYALGLRMSCAIDDCHLLHKLICLEVEVTRYNNEIDSFRKEVEFYRTPSVNMYSIYQHLITKLLRRLTGSSLETSPKADTRLRQESPRWGTKTKQQYYLFGILLVCALIIFAVKEGFQSTGPRKLQRRKRKSN